METYEVSVVEKIDTTNNHLLLTNKFFQNMKKKILGGIAVLAIAVVIAWNMNLSSRTNGMSDVMLSNVEALAADEGSNGKAGSIILTDAGREVVDNMSCRKSIVSCLGSGTYTCSPGYFYDDCYGCVFNIM